MGTARLSLSFLLPALLAGCAGLPGDEGDGAVAQLVQQRTGQAVTFGQPADHSVCQPGTAILQSGDAVRLALTCNPAIQAEYARLGLAAADVYEAGRLSNPTLSVSALSPYGDGNADLTVGIVQRFSDLLLLASRQQRASTAYEETRQDIAAAIVAQAADTEAAYYQAIAARQLHDGQQQMATAATAAADMAERFYRAGNIDALALAMHQASASAAAIALSEQAAAVRAAQGALQIQLGLPATAPALSIPAELPPPATAIPPLDVLYRQADSARLDLAAARARADRLADAAGVERRYRYLGELEIGVETERDSDGEHSVGPTLSWELPLFNQGGGRIARARAEWQAADAGLRALQVGISNDIRTHHAQLSAAAERVRAYDQQLLPLQTAIVRQTHRQVSFMLADVFTLLAARQQEYAAQQGRIAALLDYWLAHAALLRAVGSDISTAGQLSAGEKLP